MGFWIFGTEAKLEDWEVDGCAKEMWVRGLGRKQGYLPQSTQSAVLGLAEAA